LPLEFDCCEAQGKNLSLNNVLLDLPTNNVIHHLDDLKVANYKVEEVERPIAEQDWKLKTFKHGLSSLLFVLCQNDVYDLNLFYSVLLLLQVLSEALSKVFKVVESIFHIQQ
jgi:uncharacterized membrane protein YjjP (DUF1212 family)